jgi:hypothetical protein
MTDTIDKVIVEYQSVNFDNAASDVKTLTGNLDGLTEVSLSTEKSTASLENKFASLERRFQTTAAQSAQYEKIQNQVNLAVANNPALQERANAVLDAAKEKFSGAGKELGHLDEIGAVVESRMAGMGNSMGLIGQVLQVIGPVGLAAAVGLGAIAVALNYISEQANKFGESSISIRNVSDAVGLTTTEVRGLSEAAEKAGISGDSITASFERFTSNLSTAGDVTSALFKALEKVDGQLAVDVASAHSGAEAWDLVAKAINNSGDAFTKAQIAKAAFGRGGVQDIPVLQATYDAGGLKAYSEEVQKATGITDDLTRHTAQLKAEIDATKKLTANVYASIYSDDVLERQAKFARVQLEIAQAIKKSPELAGPVTDEFGTPLFDFTQSNNAGKTAAPGGAGTSGAANENTKAASAATLELESATDTLTAAQVKADAAQRVLSAVEEDGVGPVNALSEARKSLGGALELLSNQEKSHIAALNGAATNAEIYKQKTDALTASFLKGGISADTYNRALHGDTANQVAALEAQRTVIDAIGASAKRDAQYWVDYTAATKDHSGVDAQQIAAEKMANSLAAAVAAVQLQTQAMNDQNAMAALSNQYSGVELLNHQKALASQQTYNDLVKQLGKERADQAEAQAKVQAVEDSYNVKIVAAQKAAAASALDWQQGMLGVSAASQQAAASAQQTADAFDAAQKAITAAANAAGDLTGGAFGSFDVPAATGSQTNGVGAGNSFTSGGGSIFGNLQQPTGDVSAIVNNALAHGGLDSAISSAEGMHAGPSFLSPGVNGIIAPVVGPNISASDIISQVQSLYDLKNSQANDNTTKIGNDQQFMAWLMSQPETIARDQAAATLRQSIDQLNTSVGANTAAIAATLNPIYSQGHGALAIGYYHAATGLDVIAQGPSSGDTIPFQAMVNGGERIQITPAGQSGNDSRPQQTNITQVFNLPADTNSDRRRTTSQLAEGFRRSVASGR